MDYSIGRVHNISIHAPRGGSDLLILAFPFAVLAISIHAPRGGSDLPVSAFGQL